MSYNNRFSTKAKKYFDKLTDKKLKDKFRVIIFDEIALRPFEVGEKKKGKLSSC